MISGRREIRIHLFKEYIGFLPIKHLFIFILDTSLEIRMKRKISQYHFRAIF